MIAQMKLLEILVTALAYATVADGKIKVEQKSHLLSLMGKHVNLHKDLTEDQLSTLSRKAFDFARTAPLEKFIKTVTAELSSGQQAVLLMNLYDTVAADGTMADGEMDVIEKFERRLNIDLSTMKIARKVIFYKNDTTVFTNPLHSGNGPGFVFRLEDTD